MSFSVLGSPEQYAVIQVGCHKSGGVNDNPWPLATLLWIYPRIHLAFWAASAHCQLTLSYASTITPRASLPGCFQSPASLWVCHNPGVGPHTLLCWTLWGLQSPISPACPGLSRWHPFLPEHDCTTELSVVSEFTEGALNPTVSQSHWQITGINLKYFILSHSQPFHRCACVNLLQENINYSPSKVKFQNVRLNKILKIS